MSIRIKFLIALLAAVLLPTIFAALLGYRSSVIMSRTIAADQRELLLEEARGVLLAAINKNVDFFQHQTALYISAISLQQLEVRRALANDQPPAVPRLPIAEFREGGSAPALEPSGGHVIAGQEQTPVLISTAVPAIYLAPGGNQQDADRLAHTAPAFQTLVPSLSLAGYWQFITLDSGAHAVYPGHGLLSDDYDARQDSVYQRARSRIGQGYGSPPSVDPATGQILVGMAGPLTDAEGNVIGITGVLSRVDTVLHELRFGAQWGRSAENYFVLVDPTVGEEPVIRIIAKKSYAETGPGGRGFIALDSLVADDPQHQRELTESLSSGQAGALTIRIDGEPILCTYSGFQNDSVGLVSLVPTAAIASIAERGAEQIRSRARNQLLAVMLGLVAFTLGLAFAAFFGARAITQPIGALAEAIRRVAAGDLDVRADVTSNDEVGELAHAFNSMVPDLRDHLRLRNSVDLAQQVQRGLLPASPPAVPGFDIAATSLYCDETGGDYFDFIEFDQPAAGSLAVAVGDVTGHGVAAALLMATARALLRMRAALPGQLADRFADINSHLTADANDGRFMTLFLLILDADHRSARWVGAGHDPAIVYDPDADTFSELAGADLPLGVEGEWQFQERSTDTLRPGQVIVLGTDGIWETHGPDGQMYGKDRLKDTIRRHAAQGPAQAIAAAIVDEVNAFRADRPQEDDVTLVVIRLADPA